MDGLDNNNKQYSLRWEKHAFNLASEAGCFFEDESFLDCTLSAEGQCIDAHKIILSASSSYLSNLLKIMPDKHPILIFNDIKFDQLKSLVAFIYNGSVSVSESNIHAFLSAAQSLLIKGLSEETKDDDRNIENMRRHPNLPEVKGNHRKTLGKCPGVPIRKPEVYLDDGKHLKRHRQMIMATPTKMDRPVHGECEESLSKLQEISFTKYIHQNLNSKCHGGRNDQTENNKWNGPATDDKLRGPENYVVKSWKHNSIEDLNGRHKQMKNNTLKKIKLEKPPINSNLPPTNEDGQQELKGNGTGNGTGNSTGIGTRNGNGNKELRDGISASVYQTDRTKLEENVLEDKIKKEIDAEPLMLVEPKQELTEEEEEEGNSDEFDGHNASNESLNPDGESMYDGKSSSFYQQPMVDRGVPVPLLMCRTSLSEPDSVEPNWMPHIAGNAKTDPTNNSADGKDLQCRTCSQDLPCPTCTKKYKSRYALNRHILYECGKARKSFSCDECGKKVTRQDTLQKHKLIHLVQHLKKKENETDEEPSKPKKMC